MNCKAKQKTTPDKTKGQPKGSVSGSKGKGKESKGKKGKMLPSLMTMVLGGIRMPLRKRILVLMPKRQMMRTEMVLTCWF